MYRKALHSWRAIGVGAVMLLAVTIRIGLLAQGWPGPADSDEGTMGLMARHVAYAGAYPLTYYGQDFIGPQEAYLGAALFLIFGSSVFTLRLGLVLLYVVFLATIYLMTRLLYSRGLALFVLLVLALGSPEMLWAQLFAGGHAETPLYCAALILLSSWTAMTAGCDGPVRRRRCALAMSAWGLLAGFALWADPLVAPFAVAGAVVLLRAVRLVAGQRLLLLTLAGFFVGIAPLLFPYVQGFVVSDSERSSRPPETWRDWFVDSAPYRPLASIAGTLSTTLPFTLGANAICQEGPVANYGHLPEQSITIPSSCPGRLVLAWPPSFCTLAHTVWGLLFVLSGILAFRGAFCRYRQIRGRAHPCAVEAATRCFAHMGLLGGAGLTLLILIVTTVPGIEPFTSRRYLVGLLATLPALLWPLWRWALRGRARRWLLVMVVAPFSVGVVQTFTEVPAAQRNLYEQDALIARLTELGATRIYSDYWTCNRLAFASNEQIVCAALNAELAPDFDRYLPYRALVRASPYPSYVFPNDSAQDVAMASRVAVGGTGWQSIAFGDYNIYSNLPGGE